MAKFFLIQAPGDFYMAARTIGSATDFYWDKKLEKALKFFDYIQAESVMMAVRKLRPEMFAFANILEMSRIIICDSKTNDTKTETELSNDKIKTDKEFITMLAQKFVQWDLPSTVVCDKCVTESDYPFPRSGTNLLSFDEAEKLFKDLFVFIKPELDKIAKESYNNAINKASVIAKSFNTTHAIIREIERLIWK